MVHALPSEQLAPQHRSLDPQQGFELPQHGPLHAQPQQSEAMANASRTRACGESQR
jgi:hypothetical protein